MREEIHPLIAEGSIMVVPGVYDCVTAKLAEEAGFHSCVLTGYGVAASMLGEPDVGLLTQTHILDVARRVCAAVNIAVVVDGDTGYGGALNVAYMVRELIRIGAMGILLEDQVWPKRCGHLADKQVVSMEEHVSKIKAARDACAKNPFIVVARTDALGVLGIDEAIRRGRAYRDAGADVIFVEAPETVEDMRRIGKEVGPPLTCNMIEGGKTPLLPLEEMKELGFISIGYVLSALFATTYAVRQVYRYIRKQGTSLGYHDMTQFDDFIEFIGGNRRLQEDALYRAASPPSESP